MLSFIYISPVLMDYSKCINKPGGFRCDCEQGYQSHDGICEGKRSDKYFFIEKFMTKIMMGSSYDS